VDGRMIAIDPAALLSARSFDGPEYR